MLMYTFSFCFFHSSYIVYYMTGSIRTILVSKIYFIIFSLNQGHFQE